MNARQVEIAVSHYFNPRVTLMVPNVSWGFGIHECDLLCVTKSGYLYEVEIKVSKSDLRADAKKAHGHNSNKIKFLYFAVPENLLDDLSLFPERSGILKIRKANNDMIPRCSLVRRPKVNPLAKPITKDQAYQIARLGTLRFWGLRKNMFREVKE